MNEKDIPKKFPHARKIAIGLACVFAVIFFLRQPILRLIAVGLVHSDKPPLSADIMAIGGDGAGEKALAWLASHHDAKLLLAEKPPPRVVQIGATISEAERRRALSKAAGIPEDRIEVLIGTTMRSIDPGAAMQRWLSAHPQRRIHVLCDQFQSRSMRRSVVRRLGLATSTRITLEPLVDRRFSVTDWWTTRLGIRAVFDGYLGLTRSVLGLRSPKPPPYLTPDRYEQAFLDSLQLGH